MLRAYKIKEYVVLPKRESLHRGNRSNARTDWTHAAADWVFFGRVFALQEQVPDATDGDRARIYVRVREEVLFRGVSRDKDPTAERVQAEVVVRKRDLYCSTYMPA